MSDDFQISITRGDLPLVLAQPHSGTWMPDSIHRRLNSLGHQISDTDWHVPRLYAGLLDNVTTVTTPVHRYVVDANRNPSDESLYPGQNTTGLCPLTTFDGESIYLEGQQPSKDETENRQRQFHQPYHDAIQQELERVRQKHGYAILYDCHSIRSVVPYLFEDVLPDFNIGTNNGVTCAKELALAVEKTCHSASQYKTVSNARFKGGWTTRHYGQPDKGYHAIQMELAQSTYMLEKAPWTYLDNQASLLRPVLQKILSNLVTTLQ